MLYNWDHICVLCDPMSMHAHAYHYHISSPILPLPWPSHIQSSLYPYFSATILLPYLPCLNDGAGYIPRGMASSYHLSSCAQVSSLLSVRHRLLLSTPALTPQPYLSPSTTPSLQSILGLLFHCLLIVCCINLTINLTSIFGFLFFSLLDYFIAISLTWGFLAAGLHITLVGIASLLHTRSVVGLLPPLAQKGLLGHMVCLWCDTL